MHTLLERKHTNTRKISSPALALSLSRQYKSIQSIIRKYRTYGPNINNEHVLVKLVNALDIDIEMDITDAYTRGKIASTTLATTLGISNELHYADAKGPVFYPDCPNYLVTQHNMSIGDVFTLPSDMWWSMTPVTALYQPYILPLWWMPHTSRNTDMLGYSVIGIDIPALSVMCLGWLKENAKRDFTERETIGQFIGRYVIPNMLTSQHNTVLYNRIEDIASNDILHTELESRPLVYVVDYDDVIHAGLTKAVKQIQKTRMSPSEALDQIPSTVKDITLLQTVPKPPYIEVPNTFITDVLIQTPYVLTSLKLVPDYKHKGTLGNKAKAVLRTIRGQHVFHHIKEQTANEDVVIRFTEIRFMLDI